MKKLLILFLGSITLFLSCGKEACYTYKGRILAFGTKEPVSDAVVNIIAGKDANALDPQVEWLLDSVRTDKDGRFEIEVKGGDYHRIGAVIKEGFFPDLGNQETYLFEDGNLANRDYIIDPQATLHVLLEDDPNLFGGNIEIRLPGKSSSAFIYTKYEKIYFLRGDRYFSYWYETINAPKIIDSIYCPAFKTTDLFIKF